MSFSIPPTLAQLPADVGIVRCKRHREFATIDASGPHYGVTPLMHCGCHVAAVGDHEISPGVTVIRYGNQWRAQKPPGEPELTAARNVQGWFDLRRCVPPPKVDYKFTNDADFWKTWANHAMRKSFQDEFPFTSRYWIVECACSNTLAWRPIQVAPRCQCGLHPIRPETPNDTNAPAILRGGVHGFLKEEVRLVAAPNERLTYGRSLFPIVSPEVIEQILQIQKEAHDDGDIGNVGIISHLTPGRFWLHPEIFVMPNDGCIMNPNRDSGWGVLIAPTGTRDPDFLTVDRFIKWPRDLISSIWTRETTLPVTRDGKEELTRDDRADVAWRLRPEGVDGVSLIVDRADACPKKWNDPRIKWAAFNADISEVAEETKGFVSVLVIESRLSNWGMEAEQELGRHFRRVSPASLSGQIPWLEMAKGIARQYKLDRSERINIIRSPARSSPPPVDTRFNFLNYQTWPTAPLNSGPAIFVFEPSLHVTEAMVSDHALWRGLPGENVWGLAISADGKIIRTERRTGTAYDGRPTPRPRWF
jgi:hypothetical protein